MNDAPVGMAAPLPVRHPQLELSLVRQRIAERREAARWITNEVTRDVVEADTDMLEELARDVRNLRVANVVLKEVIHALQARLTAFYERYFKQ